MPVYHGTMYYLMFKSDRCGIETRDMLRGRECCDEFKSDRCGIETVAAAAWRAVHVVRSNQTVAGLKRS